jgi:hypothetical protein
MSFVPPVPGSCWNAQVSRQPARDELLKYTRSHFASEEFIAAYHYPD